MISRLARLASIVLRPTPASLNATVISSSLRVSFEVTTMPSPQRPWRTRSPSRNWRSPGMIGRGGRAATGGCADRRVAERAGRRSRLERLASGGQVAAGSEGLAVGGRARPAAALPVGRPRAADPRVEAGGPALAEHEVEVEVALGLVEPAEARPDHQLGRDLEQEPRRDGGLAHPPGRAPPRRATGTAVAWPG